MAKITIIIPCYNEEASIVSTANNVIDFVLLNYKSYDFQFILVDDGSTDGTKQKLERLQHEFPNIVEPLFLPYNQGRGKAIKRGIAHSTGDFVILLDADLSYDVQHISNIMSEFEKDPKTDTVVVSPYAKGGVVKNVPFHRLALSRMANWILVGFFDGRLSTVTCVVRGYKGPLLRALPLFEDGKELHLEILRKLSLLDAKIVEIPGRLIWKNAHKKGRRKTNLKVAGSAKNHLLYALMVKPTQLFKYLSLFLLFIAVYESFNILTATWDFYRPGPEKIRNLWIALKGSYDKSPHTFIIAAVGYILSFQTLSHWSLSQVGKMQHEEVIRHLLEILKNKNPKDF